MRVLGLSMVRRERPRSVHKIRADASNSTGTQTLNRSCSARSKTLEFEQPNKLDHSTHNAEVWGCLRCRGKSILSMSWPVRLIADTGQFSLGIEFQGDIVFLDPFAIFRAGYKVNLFRIAAEAAGFAAEHCPDIGP